MSNVYLSGLGSENFTIDLNGTIRVAQDANLDYEQSTAYGTIYVYATNEYGTTKKTIRINVLDVLDSPPKIGDIKYGTTIPENAKAGTEVAKVTISQESPLLNVLLSGRYGDKFTIDLNGTIRVAQGAVFDYDNWSTRYLSFTIEASNKFGTSSRACTISLSDVPDPVMYQTSLNVDENSKEGTFVGTARMDSDTQITEMYLTGVGSENFTVDINGTIRVAKNAVLDYESNDQYNYDIRLHATNMYGTSSIRIGIRLNDVPDTPPNVSVYGTFIVEDKQDSSVNVGGKWKNININSVIPIDNVRLGGEYSDDFRVDVNGTIHIANGVVIDINKTKQYSLSVTASNAFGESEPAEVIINVHNRAFMSFSPYDNNQTKDIVMRDIKKDIKGNIYVFGYRVKNYNETPVLIKYSSTKNIEWIKDFNATAKTENDNISVSALKLYIDNKSYMYLLGNIYGGTLDGRTLEENQTIGDRDVFTIALDNNGTGKWIKQFGTQGYDTVVGMLMKNNRLYFAVNIPNEYDVDNNENTQSKGAVYVLQQNGMVENIVQFDATDIEEINAWNLRTENNGFVIKSKVNNINRVIKLDSNLLFESSYDINETYYLRNAYVFDDAVYNISSSYTAMRVTKYGENGEIWSTEEEIGENLIGSQLYNDENSTKVLFYAGDKWTYEGMVAGCIGYYFEYDMQGQIIDRKYYGLRNYPCSKPFLIGGKVYLLE